MSSLIPNDALYSNRFPSDTPRDIVACRLIKPDDRWKTISPGGTVWTAKGLHIFVVKNGILLVNKVKSIPYDPNPVGHVDLARYDPIQFGGEIKFGCANSGRGVIRWWNDRTGHFNDPKRPMDPKIVPDLPQAKFRPYSMSRGSR